MEINRDQIKNIWGIVRNTNQDQIHSLNAQEKKIVAAVIKSVKNGDVSLYIDNPNVLNDLTLKLKLKIVNNNEVPSKIIQLKSYLFHILGIEIKSSSLLNKIDKLNDKMVLLPTINKKIEKLDNENKELFELIDFKENFLIEVYQGMADFYQKLPEKQEDAKPLVQVKINEINETIAKLKSSNDPDEKSKLHTLEKEILKNLVSVEKYKGKEWGTELNRNKEVWVNTAKNASSIQGEKDLIVGNQQQITKMLKEKESIERLM